MESALPSKVGFPHLTFLAHESLDLLQFHGLSVQRTKPKNVRGSNILLLSEYAGLIHFMALLTLGKWDVLSMSC